MTLCIRAFHMTSIVISLYFKQENCETLISCYNWGQMKRCQSELVSCKVEWFCSLAVFSRWPGLSLFLSISVCPFPCSLLALCASFFFLWKTEKRLCSPGPGGEGRVIRASMWPITVVQVLGTCCMWFDCGRPAAGSNHPQASPFYQQLVFTTDQRCAFCTGVCLAPLFVLICIQLDEKQVLPSLSCCIKWSTNSSV